MISASFNSMGLTSLQVCMDSSDWLQGTIHDETGGILDSSSSSPSSAGGDMLNLTCSSSRGGVALISERRLRPPHDQALKCPRCDSTHTKFCYYNNYSLSQPRYFCKTCRRYWTKGGTLRNIPVGGGCRKSSNTKKGNSSKKSSNDLITPQNLGSSSSVNNNINPTEQQQHLHLALLNAANHHDQMQFPHFANSILGNPSNNFYVTNNPTLPIDFLGNGEMGSVLNGDMMINSPAGIINPGGGGGGGPMNFHNLCSPYGMYLDGNYKNSGANYMLTYETNNEDVKPNGKHLSLEWNDHQGLSTDQVGNQVDSANYDYFNGVGSSSWTGLMNGYGTSATNPLV